jgi:cell division initiation protein
VRLSPLDISKQEFSKSMRGYDTAEVRAFLEKVSDELAELETENKRLAQQNLKANTQLESYEQMEKSLRESLLTAQRTLEEARTSAEREHDLLLREARAEAEQIVHEAQRNVHEFREELRRLTVQRDAYIKRLRFLLSSQQELIDMLEEETPLSEPKA